MRPRRQQRQAAARAQVVPGRPETSMAASIATSIASPIATSVAASIFVAALTSVAALAAPVAASPGLAPASAVGAVEPGQVAARPTLAALLLRAQLVLDRVRRDRLAAARPVPVMVRWSPRRIATLDVGGALGALLGADLDGDHTPELYAVTDQAVIVYGLSEGKLREVARLPFPGDAAPIRPRDPVATVAVDLASGELMAGSSSYAHSVRAKWQAGALVVQEELDGLPLCAHRRAALVPGRNYFDDRGLGAGAGSRGSRDPEDKDRHFGERCRDEVTLLDGSKARAVARLPVDGPLQLSIEPRCDGACQTRRYEIAGVGVAYDIGDVDRDGRLDVAYAGAGAPGDPDAVRVVPISEPRRTLYRRAFTGGVAAVALVDLDGDGAAEVIAAVRLPGSPRVDLWRLN